jgi:hypothetical protein
MDVETFAEKLGAELKVHGFKKQRLNWRMDLPSSIAVLNVQLSPWGDGSYYINVGIYLKAIGGEPNPPHNRCHVQQRLELGTPAEVAKAAFTWFNERGSIEALSDLVQHVDIQKQGLVFHEVISAIDVHRQSAPHRPTKQISPE